MPLEKDDIQTQLQAKVFDFALNDLVRRNREAFQPLWTVDSWAKFLIWMSLNCGLSGDRESLEIFAKALGHNLSARIRQIFFERTLQKYSVKIFADPAEPKILVVSTDQQQLLSNEVALKAIEEVELLQRVVTDIETWEILHEVIAIPWQVAETL